MHGWVKINPLKCIENTKKNLTPISPNRIGRNFGNLLVFVSSFMDNHRTNRDFGTQVRLLDLAHWRFKGGWVAMGPLGAQNLLPNTAAEPTKHKPGG